MASKKILKLVKTCAKCVTKPCQIGCPLNNDIPGFIEKIGQKDYQGSFEILSKTSMLMPICGRICPHYKQCEAACVKGISYKSVKIGELETFIGDMWLNKEWLVTVPRKTTYKVAVIGGGPAGLTCAAFLRRNGVGVTIYEKHNYLGGLLMHGIPEFRLPKKIVRKVIKKILNLGIKVKYNMELGKNLSLDKLKKEYDAVFIGIGANKSNILDIPGEKLLNVCGANELLESRLNFGYKGKTVVIVGAGDTAMDTARIIKRRGADKVIIIYYKSKNEMSADPKEIKIAKKEGIEFLFLTNLVKIIGDTYVSAIEVVKTEMVLDENTHKLVVKNIDNSNHEIKCNYVLFAIGSHPDDCVRQIKVGKNRDRILINQDGSTSDNKIFAGGDVAGIKSTVAWASKSGRTAAYSILKYLNK